MMIPRRGVSRTRLAGMALVSLMLNACVASYNPRPTYFLPPDKMDGSGAVPKTKVSIGVTFCGTTDKLDRFFPPQNGLLKEGILPTFVSLRSSDTATYRVSYDSFRMGLGDRTYVPISPANVFDVAWQAKEPFIAAKKTLYYSVLTIFTIATAGLGSVIWVLPSPFKQPKYDSDPFGRDLAYKAFPTGAILAPGETLGGMLYFHVLEKPQKRSDKSSLTVVLAKERTPSESLAGTLTFQFSSTVEKEHAADWINGLLTP